MNSGSYVIFVEGTLWTLLAFSVISWALVLVKGVQHGRIASQNRRYKKAFWGASDLLRASELKNFKGPAARLAEAGFSALREADNGPHDLEHSGDRQDLLERHLRQQLQKERRFLESGLAILASIGSTAPFVGLFGTVWGILGALQDISQTGSASLDVVAGPIGEALVATGIGIAVAVPAVLAYNFFLRRLKLVWADLEDFATDLVTLTQKAAFRLPKASSARDTAPKAGQAQGVAANELQGREVLV